MNIRKALPGIIFWIGIILTLLAWSIGRDMLRTARLANFERETDSAILQTQQFINRQMDILRSFQAYALSSPRAEALDFNSFVTRIVDDTSPIMSIFRIDLDKPPQQQIDILFDRNVFRAIYNHQNHILSDAKHQTAIDPFFIGIFSDTTSKQNLLVFGIPIDNMNPNISHDQFVAVMIDTSTLVKVARMDGSEHFLEVSVSSDISPKQSLFPARTDVYEEHGDRYFERSETIRSLGSDWHFHFDREWETTFLGIPETSFILIIGSILSFVAAIGLHVILQALANAERERDERMVVDEKRRLMEAVVTSASDGVVITKADTVNYPGPEIIYVNHAQAALSGYEAHELIGQSPRLFQSTQTDKADLQKIKDCLIAGRPYRGELMNRTRDGQDYWVDLSIVPVRNEQGTVTHFAALQRDITDQRAQQTALYEASRQAELNTRLKSEFLATMSHEIRTPLNGIIGMASLLLDSTLEYQQRHQAQTVLESAETLLQLLNDILDFSKIEAGKLDIEHIAFDINNITEQLVDMMAPQARRKGLELLLRADQNITPYVFGDPGRLRQILFNLVGNAIKFTETGFVRIDITETPDFSLPPDQTRLRFAISDTGIGINPDKLGLIFDKFSQADSSTTRQFGGSGLGLAICQQLCHLMGGQIGVESKLGVGSTFWFTLVVGRANRDDMPGDDDFLATDFSKNIGLDHGAFEGVSILLAEDNPVNGLVFTQALERLGCVVTHVIDGKQALETAATGNFDLVLLDCQMPVMDGYTAATELRNDMASGILRKMPIIALTASAMKGDREKCLAAGMDDYLTKPLDFSALVATMRRWLGGDVDHNGASLMPTAQPTGDINWTAFDECADIMGDGMADMIERFLISVQNYITRIAEGHEQQDCQKINKAAHPLKSSAAQIGAQHVAAIAHRIEMLTLAEHYPVWTEIEAELDDLINQLQQGFDRATPMLQERARMLQTPLTS